MFSFKSNLSTLKKHFLLALIVLILPSFAMAANITWSGGGADNNWNTALNWSGGAVPGSGDNVTFDSTSTKNCTINVNISVVSITINSGYTGTITQASGNTITIGSGSYTQNDGTFAGGDSAITINSLFDLNAGTFTSTSGLLTSNTTSNTNIFDLATAATFNHNNGTVKFTGGNHFSIDTHSSSLFNVEINKCGTCGSSGRLDVDGDLTLTSASYTSMDITLAGNLSGAAVTHHSGSGKITFDGSGNQTSTFTGRLPNVTVNKSGGTLTFSNDFAISNKFTHVAGDVVFTGTTVSFTYGDHWSIDSGSVEFNNVIVDKCTTCNTTVTGTWKVGGNFTLTENGQFNTGAIEIKGNLTSTDTSSTGSATVTLTGTNDQTITASSSDLPDGTFTINKASGKVTLASNLSLNGTGQDLTVTSGTLDVAGYNLSVTDVLTITDKLKLKGNETFTYTTFSLNTSSSTVEYYDSAVTADLSKLPPSTFHNFILGSGKTHNFETGSGNEITINGSFSSNGTSSSKSVLRSLTSGTQWFLKVTGTESISDNVDVKDSKATNGISITAYYSTDSGNNNNWVFQPPSITWDGGGSTTNFSEAANWSTNTVPTSTDKIVFDSTSTKNCVVNIDTTVKEVLIGTGYTGVFTLTSDFTVNEKFTQVAGSVDLGAESLTLKGNLSVSNPANFQAGTSTVTFTDPGSSVTNTITGAINLHNVVLNLNGHLSIGSYIYLNGNLTYTKGYIDGGSLKVEGNVTQGINSNGGTGILEFTGIWFQNFTGSGMRGVGELPDVKVNKPSGTLTLVSVINTKNDWEHVEGTVAYATSELCFNGSSQTFTNNGMSLNDFYINMSGALTVSGTLPVKGNLYVNAWTVLNGDIYAYGNVTTAVTSQSNTTGKVHFVGGNSQTFSGAGVNGLFTKVSVEKIGSTTLNITDAIRLYGDFTVVSGTLNSTGTLTLTGTSATLTSNGQSLNNLTLDTSGAITVSGTLSVLGDLYVKSADALSGSVIQLKKNLTLEDSDFTGTAKTKIQMIGNDNATITKVSSGILDNGDIEIKKTGGASVTLAGNLTLNNGFLHNLTGNLDLDGYNLTTSSDVDVDDTLTLKGNETVTASAFTVDTSTSKVIYKDSSVTAYLSNLPFSTFKHLTLGAGKTHIFESGSGNQIQINGTFATNSTESSKATLRSDVNGTQWYIKTTTATTFANKVDVKDSNASNGLSINAISSTNSGNNTNWDFSTMPAFAWTGAVDNNWNTAGNWGTGVVPGVNDVALFSSVYSNNNCTINASISIKGILIEATYTGTITQGSGNTITIGSTDWIQNGGTFTGNNAAITINGEFTLNSGTFTSTSSTFTSNTTFSGDIFKIVSGATFNHNSGLISFTGSNHYNIYTAGQSLNNVSINKGGSSGSVGNMVVAGYLEVLSSGSNNLTITLYGDLIGNNTNFGGGGEVKFVGTANQSITYPGQLPNIKIDKSGGTLSFDSDFTATKDIIKLNGTVDPKTSTITLTTNHATITPNGMEFYNIVWNRGNSADTTVSNEMVIRNNFTLTTANQINTGPIVVKGSFTTTDTSVSGNAQLIFGGSSAQTATFNGYDMPNGLITIDNASGVTFVGTTTLNGSGQDLLVKTGKLTVSTGGLTVPDQLTLSASTTLEIPSYAPVTATVANIDPTSIVKFTPITNSVNNTIDLNKFTQTFGYLEIDSSEIGDVYQFTKDTTVINELKLANATTKVNQTAGTLTLKANLANLGGTFVSYAKVVLSGTSQQIQGSNTFYDFVKSEDVTSTLTLEAGKTQSITHSVELQGRPNNKLSLRSTITGTQWSLTVPATSSYSFLDIKDSNNPGTTIVVDQTNTDSGNNTGWSFSGVNSYTWIGNTSTAWSTASNWSGSAVPGANDVAILDFNTGTYAPTISGTSSVGGIHVDTNFNRTVTLSSGAALTVGSKDLFVAGGTFNASAGNVTIDGTFTLTGSATYSASSFRTYAKGDWRNQGGTFVDNNGTVIFNGSVDQTLETGGTTSSKDFYRIYLEKSAGTLYLKSALKTNDNLEIRGLSSFDMQGQNITVGKDLHVFGKVTLQGGETLTYSGVLTNQGEVNYVGTGTYSSLLLGNRYTTVVFKNGGTYTHTGDLFVDDGLYIEKNTTLISQSGKNIKTSRVWSNLGTYTANGSTVEFDGFISEVYGTTSFYNLKKFAKVKDDWMIFYIGTADVITINGKLEMAGLPDSPMWFNGYYQYRINLQGTADIKYCQIKSCINLGNTITVDGTNIDKFYNVNWVFNSGKDYQWTGATSNAWGTASNWSGSAVPGVNDVAIITNDTNNAPSISSAVNVKGIILSSDFTGSLTQTGTASITVGRYGLNVLGGTFTGSSGDLTINGPFFQSGGTINDGAGTISVSGFTQKTGGTLTLDSGVFKLNSSSYEQEVNFGSVQSFKKLILNNTNNEIHFKDFGITATDLEVKAGANAKFQDGSITTVTNLTVSGTSANYANLGSLNPGESWGIKVSGTQSVNYLKVADADASTGSLITANNSIDLSNNINWDFGGIADMVIYITPDKKPFKANLDVNISFTMPGTDGSGVQIYYTLDGSTPDNTKTHYTGSFRIDDTFTIKAVGYANGNYSSVFQKDYVKVDLAHLYARKTYGAGAALRLGETRRFEAQVWWMGENLVPEVEEYYDNNTFAPVFGGDDVRMPEFDDDIEWYSTGSTIVKSTTTEYGGSAIWTDDGFTTGYTITVKIGPNSFTGCNNNTGYEYTIKGCGCGDEGQKSGCISSGATVSSADPEKWTVERGEACSENSSGSIRDVTLGCYGDNAGGSPIPLPTNGPKVDLHVIINSGAYEMKPYTFGHAARATDFNELRVINDSNVVVHFVRNKTSSYYLYVKNGTGKYYTDSGDEAYVEKVVGYDQYQFVTAKNEKLLFAKIDNLPSNEYRLIKITDRSGNIITHDYETYKANNKMVITDATGNTYTVFAETTVAGVKLISKIVTKDIVTSVEKTWTYTYDANGFLIRERYEDLYTEKGYGDYEFELDRHGNLLSGKDFAGSTFSREYDTTWRVTKALLPTSQNTDVTRSYVNGTYDIVSKDPLGYSTIVTVDNGIVNSLPRKKIMPDGLIEEYSYNSTGFITKKIQKLDADPANDIVTTYAYSSTNRLTKTIVDPTGLAITTVTLYDSSGNITRNIDPNGVITDYLFDSNNRMTKEIKDVGGLNITNEWLFDSNGNMTKTIDPIGKTKIWEYNSKGLVTKAINQIGGFELFEYNNAGKQTKHTDFNGNITIYQYDVLNRLTKTTDAAGYYEAKEYNSNGFVTKFTDKIGSITNYYYDQLNHLTLIGGDAAAPGGGCACSGGTNANGQEGIYEYSWNGKLTKFTDVEYLDSNGTRGNFKFYEYDSMYRLTRTIVDPYGLAIIKEQEYDKIGRLTKVRKINYDGEDDITINEYDKNSRMIATKQVLNGTYLTTRVEYDKLRNYTKIIDPNSNAITIHYDKLYRVTRKIDSENLYFDSYYSNDGKITKQILDINNLNIETLYLYDDEKKITKITESDGGQYSLKYDNNSNIIELKDPEGNVIQNFFDARNLLTKRADEINSQLTYEYDGLGNITTFVNSEGMITKFLYNDKSFLTKKIEDYSGIGRTTEYYYDEMQHLSKQIEPSGSVILVLYDQVYRVTKTIHDSGGKNLEKSMFYDSLFRITRVINQGSYDTLIEFDQVSRVTKLISADSGIVSFEYDNLSNITKKIMSIDLNTNRTDHIFYDKVYRVTKLINDVDNINITTFMQYDALHRLTKIVNAKNQSTNFYYDNKNRMTRKVFEDGSIVEMKYDVDSKLTKFVKPDGSQCTYLYDARGLLTKKTYGVSGEQTFTWDAMRRKTQDTDNNSNNQLVTMTYEFDKLSRMTKQTEKIGSGSTQNVSKFYDTIGLRTRVTYPHGRNVDTTYTTLHQVNEIKTDVGAGIQTVANYDYLYDLGGSDKRPLVAKNTLHSGTDTRVDFSYDSVGRVTKKNWVDISASTTLSGFEYTYNLFGNRLTDNQLDRSQDSQTYYYDTAQRFTKMERGTIGGTPSFYQSYTLDGLANWSSFNNNGSSESRTHNSMNAVTVRGSTNLTYDANGNLTNDGNQKYIWDSLNRLIEVRDSSNNIICDYYYNADNLRAEKHHAGGSKEQFYYDGARVLVETDGSQNKVREYVNGGQYIDEVILVANTVGASTTYNYYMSDLRYCVSGFIDSSGNVVERARYDGYGKRTLLDASYATITTANVNQSYGYTGIRHDNESGLQYYRARYFDNYLGRFINRDPIGYSAGINLYSGYFIANKLDPFGMDDTWNQPSSFTGDYNVSNQEMMDEFMRQNENGTAQEWMSSLSTQARINLEAEALYLRTKLMLNESIDQEVSDELTYCCEDEMPKYVDPAGNECCLENAQSITVRIDAPALGPSSGLSSGAVGGDLPWNDDFDVGHGFLNINLGQQVSDSDLSQMSIGFYPGSSGFSGNGPGRFVNDNDHLWDISSVCLVCPETISSILISISIDLQSPPNYNYLSRGDSTQCIGWATSTLESNGISDVPTGNAPGWAAIHTFFGGADCEE